MQPDFDIDLYNERLNALYSRFQSVQKVGFTGDAYKPGLSGMARFSALLGDPWKEYPCIHVAGTNGKGSVCSMLASALAAGCGGLMHADGQCRYPGHLFSGTEPALCPSRMACGEAVASGGQVGLYTSPHLLDFRERMKIISDGGFEMITREEVWEFLNLYEKDFDGLSFFEITTGMAFWWFARRGVDAAVIEVGLGGRLDSTNIITPVLSVVTSIGLDHCALLGSTRAEIAFEKAGIFKPGVPALVGVRDVETASVFEEVATSVGAPLTFASDMPKFDSAESSILSRMDLTGPCQDLNLHTVLAALHLLSPVSDTKMAPSVSARPFWPTQTPIKAQRCLLDRFGQRRHQNGPDGVCPPISDTPDTKTGIQVEIADAIAAAATRTGLWGRWQRICTKPEVICDIGHNPPALKENFGRLKKLQEEGRSIIIVYGIMADKDLSGIAPLMPDAAGYILAAPDNQRAMPAEELLQRLKQLRPDLDCQIGAGYGTDGTPGPEGSVRGAVQQALSLAQDLPKPLIYIGGSTFVVAEALPLFNKNTEA